MIAGRKKLIRYPLIWTGLAIVLLLWCRPLVAGPVKVQVSSPNHVSRSLADRRIQWPTWKQWRRVMLMKDYNTRVVVWGTTLLGCAAGMVGSFTLLRKRALMGDALSHATLPGIGSAFIVATALGYDGKSLPLLLLGATITGLIGVGAILLIRRATKLKEDVALGAVLSVFFGAGMALMAICQQQGNAAGLEGFIYGKTASMGLADTQWIAAAAALSILAGLLVFKEFKLLCFDDQFAGSEGFPVSLLDLLLMTLVVIVCIVGLQAVGIILMIALLVIPAAAARFWSENMQRMTIVAAFLGAAGGMLGATTSALFPRLPSGAMIVLVCTAFFVVSLFLGTARGVVIRSWRKWQLNRSVAEQHLLRAMYEVLELRLGLHEMASHHVAKELKEHVSLEELVVRRSWSRDSLRREVRRAQNAGWITQTNERLKFRQTGLQEAERLTRQHRLWELYLITHADVAPGRVDRAADAIEHVLEPEIVAELEESLARKFPPFPASPHALNRPEQDTGGFTEKGA